MSIASERDELLTLEHLHSGRGCAVTCVAPILRFARDAFSDCVSHYDVEISLRRLGIITRDTRSGTDGGALALEFRSHDAALSFLVQCNDLITRRRYQATSARRGVRGLD